MDMQISRAGKLDEQRFLRERDLKNKRFALFLWRVANGGVFVFFVFANYLMRQQTTWPPPGVERLSATIPAVITLGLLVSAWTANSVQRAILRDDRAGMQRSIILTLGLGLAFLIGIAFVCRQVPFSGRHSSLFFTTTAFDTCHRLP